MREKNLRVVLILLLLSVLACSLNTQLVRSGSTVENEGTVVRVIPELVELDGDLVGQTFDVAVVIEDVSGLTGLDIRFEWNATYLQYVNHIRTAPVEYYPAPIPPSPYPGIIHAPFIRFEDLILPGQLWTWFATLGGPSFNGSGTVFVITFRVRMQPQPHEEDVTLTLSLSITDLGSPLGLIPHAVVNGTVILHKLSTYEMHITSSPPLSVPFTIDGDSWFTPYSGFLVQGPYVLEMPEIHNVGDARYFWSQWSDGDPSRSRTVTLDSNVSLIAEYTGPYYELTVTSTPIAGVTFTINGTPETTPFSDWLLEGAHVIEMSEVHDLYCWEYWQDNEDTDRTRAISLYGTSTYTAVYDYCIGGTAVSIKRVNPSSWIAATLLIFSAVVASGLFSKRRRTK